MARGKRGAVRLCGLVSLLLCFAVPSGAEPEATKPAGAATLQPSQAQAEPVDIVIDEGTIRAALEEVKLSDVAVSVFEQTRIEILFIEEANGEAKVSDAFEPLPLEEGLRRLLAGYNFVPVYAQDADAPDAEPVLVRVMVLPSAEGELDPLLPRAGEAGNAEEGRPAASARRQGEIPPEVLENLPQAAEIAAALKEAIGSSIETSDDPEVAAVLEMLLEHDLESMIQSAQNADPSENPMQQLEALTEQLELQLQGIGAEGAAPEMPPPSGGGLPTE